MQPARYAATGPQTNTKNRSPKNDPGDEMMKRLPALPTTLALAASVAVAAAFSVPAHAASSTRFLIISENGKQIGEQVVEHQDDGLTKVRFIYKDNGRGPELTEQFRMGADGVMTQYDVKGNSTFGAVVDEHFERKDGKATWKSTSEQGSIAVSGAGMYLPMNSSFEIASASITALAAAPDHKLPLLPSGTLSQRTLDTVDVSANGKTEKVQLLADNAAKLQHPLSGLTVIRNVRVFDSDKATVGAPSDVYVLRGRITEVVPAGAPVRGAVNEIDGNGRIMLPGLFDMHAHVDRWSDALHVSAGVTSARDMGNDNSQLQMELDETIAGKLLAPQVVPAGFLEGESPYSANNGFVISTLPQAKNAVDWYAEHGYPQLKIYNSFPKAILKETIAYAHSRGMRVSGHIPAGLRAQQALDAGYDEIQHINQVMLNFVMEPDTDTRTLQRFILPAEKVADLDFNSKPVKDFVAELAKKQISIDSTLATFAFLKQKDGDMNEPFAPVADHMPPDVKRGFSVGTMNIPDAATLKRYEKSYAKMVQFVGIMYRAGVPLVAGTDELAGFTLQAELEFLVKAGLTPSQALRVATRNGARYTRTSNERGSVTAGKLADLVLVDGDPTKNIGDVRKVAAVITRGYLIYPTEIDAAYGIAPFVSDVPALKALAPVSTDHAGSNDGAWSRVSGLARKRD